jgi:proteasome lid subunit RPN8/RPN11
MAVNREAYAELVAHARSSVDAEVCGVLAGQRCEDDEGGFILVEAVIRSTVAAGGATHVTFTQAAWNEIHATLERNHPRLRIVGWYHSHPGFGVEFSDMDLFIQRNFFSGPGQIALVMDPLSGAVAVCYNAPAGIEYLPRFWVDGRECVAQVPAKSGAASGAEGAPSTLPAEISQKLSDLEARVGQLVLAFDEQKASVQRLLLLAGMLTCTVVLGAGGYAVYQQLRARVEPPRNVGFAPVPVQIGSNTALLGVQVVSWQLPPELDVVQRAVEELRHELERERERTASTNAAPRTNQAGTAIASPGQVAAPSSAPPATNHPTRP